jgi:hypothetical protein
MTSNVIELNSGKYRVEYILNEKKKVVGITHSKWPFAIMSNEGDRAIVWKEDNCQFGALPKDEFNVLLMSWLLIDDPDLIDKAAIK